MNNMNLLQKKEELKQYLESPTEFRWIVNQVLDEYLESTDFKKSVLRIIEAQNWNTPAGMVEDAVEETRYLDRVESEIYTRIQIAC